MSGERGERGGWLDEVGRQLRAVGDALWGEVQGSGLLPLLQPAPPFDRPAFASPVVAVGGLVALVLLSGLAVGGLAAMLLALLGLYLLLVELFGLSIELNPFGGFATR
jgi:hypothetical protein